MPHWNPAQQLSAGLQPGLHTMKPHSARSSTVEKAAVLQHAVIITCVVNGSPVGG